MKAGILSFQELIDALEHIEVDQLHSDIPANVRAELTRMKRNLSAILSFLGNQMHQDRALEPGVSQAIVAVRQECMALHLTITKVLLFQFFRLDLVRKSQYSALAAAQYERIGGAVCEICQAFAPQLTAELGSAL